MTNNEYRRYAAECLLIADGITNAESRMLLLAMAQASWRDELRKMLPAMFWASRIPHRARKPRRPSDRSVQAKRYFLCIRGAHSICEAKASCPTCKPSNS
jgi:hypothetical protein